MEAVHWLHQNSPLTYGKYFQYGVFQPLIRNYDVRDVEEKVQNSVLPDMRELVAGCSKFICMTDGIFREPTREKRKRSRHFQNWRIKTRSVSWCDIKTNIAQRRDGWAGKRKNVLVRSSGATFALFSFIICYFDWSNAFLLLQKVDFANAGRCRGYTLPRRVESIKGSAVRLVIITAKIV